MQNAEVWLKGLAAAFISAAATSIAGAVITNFHDLRTAALTGLVSGAVGAVLYLKQSPVPK